jgi:hypothetical protein
MPGGACESGVRMGSWVSRYKAMARRGGGCELWLSGGVLVQQAQALASIPWLPLGELDEG